MRGTLPRDVAQFKTCGIIPAYAGNTSSTCLRVPPPRDHPRVCGEHVRGWKFRRSRGDHPRVCGEHNLPCVDQIVTTGSSPRMRGTPSCPRNPLPPPGIIPAYAGNTPEPTANRIPRRGSSPRMRGTPADVGVKKGEKGIIPAYAGNTGVVALLCFLSWDHPRVCGEHSDTTADNSSMTGSSPRMRGTLTRGYRLE